MIIFGDWAPHIKIFTGLISSLFSKCDSNKFKFLYGCPLVDEGACMGWVDVWDGSIYSNNIKKPREGFVAQNGE